jgi:glycosyltransferase involved in cell wall biosynthesis
MKKIIINGRFLERRITGVARYAREVALRLLHRENVCIALPQPSHPEINPARILHVPLGNISSLTGGRGWPQLDLPRHVGRNLLWSPENVGPLGVDLQVLTVHDLAAVDHPEWFHSSLTLTYQLYLPLLVRRAPLIFAVSEFTRGRLIERLNVPPEKIVVTYNAADVRFCRQPDAEVAEVQTQLKLPHSYLLCLGSIEPRKNLVSLLQAWNSLPRSVTDEVALVMVGGQDRVFARLDLRKLLENARNVVFTGYLDDAMLPALYSGALGLIYPTLYEGFGLPPLEAMACGTPVITSNCTSLPEVVGSDAVLVDPRNPESIRQAILTLVGDVQLRERLSVAGLERAKTFSWEQTARVTYDALCKLL